MTPLATAPHRPDLTASSNGSSGFDRIVVLAAAVTGAPMAAIFLNGDEPIAVTDSARSWLTRSTGSPFSIEKVLAEGVLVVENAAADPRFADHALVATEPFVRFFAAAPVLGPDAAVVGRLCVYDTAPRPLTAEQQVELEHLAGQVGGLIRVRDRTLELERQLADLQQSQLALQQRAQLLEGMLAHADVLVYAKDLDERFLYANPALEESVNVPGGLVGRANYEVFPTDWAEEYRDNDALIASSGKGEVFDEEIVHPDGSIRQLRSTKYPLRDADGTVYAIAGVSTDVTELASARAAHQDAEQRWRSLVEHSSVAVGVIGADRRITYLNPTGLALLASGRGGVIEGRPFTDFVPDDAKSYAAALFRSVLTSGQPLEGRRWSLLRLDGSEVTVEIHASSVTHHGEPAVQVEVRDISARAAAEDALRESERRFRAVFKDSPVAMALSDERGKWIDMNEVFCELFARRSAELIGKTAAEFVHPADRGIVDGSEEGQLASPDGIYRMESRFLRPSGEVRWTSISVTATSGPKGEQWTLAVVEDITTRKAAEASLRQSEAELAAIADVARCVQSGDDPRPVVVTAIRRLSGAATVSMIERNEDDALAVTTSSGADLIGVAVELDDLSIAGTVWASGESIFVSDVATNVTVNAVISRMVGTVSALWQPVIVSGSVQAVLLTTWTEQIDSPTDRAARAVQILADEAATSMTATRLRRDLERSASTDPLTGALNRRAWDSLLGECVAVAAATGTPLTVALVDLDFFKAFNDTHGHSAGDVLLRDFATAARGCLRKGDLFARWGGEEFTVALPDVDPATALLILERVRAAVPQGQTCSIGFTNWASGEPVGSSIARADAALYDAKHGGRDRVSSRPADQSGDH